MPLTTTSSSVSSTTPSAEDALLLKLKSQFGDIDLSGMLQHGEEKQEGTESEESSLADPTPEELAAWQERQFKKGKQDLEFKKQLVMTPLQRRRELKKKYSHDADEEDWEQVAALPTLHTNSVFFPKRDEMGNEFLGVHPLLQQLVQEGDPEILGTTWMRLYSSAEGDGLSFHKFLDSIRGYSGPTVTLIGTAPSEQHSTGTRKSGVTLGFYTTSGWHESSEMFGTSDCFLFALDETNNKVNFFRPLEAKDKESKKYMYCHPSSLSNKKVGGRSSSRREATDGSVHGVGFGGTPNKPRLHLTENLENCRAMTYCSKFDAGDLLMGTGDDSLYYFDADCLEVWAVGGDEWISESLETQRKEQDVAASTRLRARKVDKKQFVDDLRSGLLGAHKNHHNGMNNGLFDHVQHTAGRL